MNIFQMSISAGLLVLAIVVIRAVALNRLPKTMFLVLWGIVLLRLLIPVSIPSQYSVYNIYDGLFSGDAPAASMSESLQPPMDDDMEGQNLPMLEDSAAARDLQAAREQAPTLNIAPITAIWVIGMVAAFIFFAVIYFKNHRALRFAARISGNDFLSEWLAEHRLLRPITIAQSDRITTPLAVGLIRPRIILPKFMDMDDKPLLGYVLTHEYYHIKRCDAFWKMLLVLALCVHWFNPMVWVMFVLANRDLELTCDEMVIRRFGAETRTAYAYTLISMAEQRSKFNPLYIGYSKNATEERIVSIMKNKKASFLASILAVALVSALTVGVLAASAADGQSDGKNSGALSGYVPPISLDDLSGERIDHAGVLADEALANEQKDVQALFISEVLRKYRDNVGGLILCSLYKGTQYGDLWSVSAISKDRASSYECVIERGTMKVLELRRDEPSPYITMDDSFVLGQRHDGDEAKAIIVTEGSGVTSNDEKRIDGSGGEIAVEETDDMAFGVWDYSRNEKHDDGNGHEIVATEKPAAPQIPLMTPGEDSVRLSFAEGKEWVIDIGYQYVEQRITIFIDSAYENDFIVGIKSLSTGELYSQNLTGSGIVSIVVPESDDYAIYIKNIRGQARVALSYSIT